MLKIFVVEEYGYRCWIWRYPGGRKQLLADWQAGRAPLDFFDPRNSKFDGELEHFQTGIFPRVNKNLSEQGYDAYIHTHEPEDTYLQFDGEPVIPQDPEKWDGAIE